MTSTTVVAGVRQFLLSYPPYTLMAAEDVDFLARALELAYFAPGEKIIGPDDGPPAALYLIKQGVVEGVRSIQGQPQPVGEAPMVQLTPGDGFPVGALMADRAVNAVYRSAGDTFCWRLPKAKFDELTQRSAVFLDFCRRRIAAMLDLSNKALQATYAAQATQWRSMSAPLQSVLRREPITVPADESLEATFRLMQDEGVGSVIVLGPADAASGKRPVAGIFTEKDLIGRVVLPQLPLDAPISQVMTSPVATLDAGAPVSDAMLLMAERTIRHVPVVSDGALVGILTERDLFALQRRSLRQIGDSIRHARRLSELVRAATDIREWSQALVAQGVAAGFATRLISRLNDQLTARLIAMTARDQAVPIQHICWLALGSEGREEQTIATDQDNGLIIGSESTTPREALLLFAQTVNQRLDECGYPLCKGGIMAGNPKWCLTEAQWSAQFDDWIDRGDPTSLLNANIFFDFRSLSGAGQLAVHLRDHVTGRAQANRRFLKQMSDNALRNSPPPSWTGGVLEQIFTSEAAVVDLKLNGTAPFVDGARLLALAAGIRATGTAERFEALAERGAIPQGEVRAWTDAFQFLQSLRLRVQHEQREAVENPNLLDTRQISDLDRRILREAFRQARKLQQRLALDYPG